jgi:hypothetical protein
MKSYLTRPQVRKNVSWLLFFVLLLLSSWLSISCGGKKQPAAASGTQVATKIPDRLPARIADGTNKEVLVMTLGDIKTPLADGTFYPVEDRIVLNNGQEINDYFKTKLGIKFYQPLDKSIFPLPPSGWCTWYYYYGEVNQEEVEKNAVWLAKNLKDYGLEYCQLDDGWQGRGLGSPVDYRDWSNVNQRFSKGLDSLARFIKGQGLVPGLWLAPHGQSNEEVVKTSRAFLLTPEGESPSSTWEGKFLLDPSKPEALSYLTELFTKLSADWGFEYFKIDGQPIVVDEYRQKQEFMASPGDPEQLYRRTLETIRQAIGPNRFLLGCWGTPLEGAGIFNGSRTGGDIVPAWEGFQVAAEATMKYYFLHNIVWYSDPDVMLVRYPLTKDMARAWASLQGLTGQALMASDRMYDLPADRVEILKRIYPAVDIRPLDLFPSSHFKKIWDLKINHLGRQYDVVGCFNYDQDQSQGLEVKWADLGLEDNARYHIYDFWNKEYLGCVEKGIYVTIPPAGVRVLTLVKDNGQPQLISTSRHITQGWVELESLAYEPENRVMRGQSRVIKGDPYELRFAFPRNERYLRIKRVEAPGYNFSLENHDGWATVTLSSQSNDTVSWEVYFETGDVYNYPARTPAGLKAEIRSLNKVRLDWQPLYYLNAGYFIYLNGQPYLYTPINCSELSGLNPDEDYLVEVRGVWLDGTTSEKAASLQLRLSAVLPAEVYLSDLEPQYLVSGWGSPRMNRSAAGTPLKIGDRTYRSGIGTNARSEAVFDLGGIFKTFESEIGLDAAAGGQGSVEFKIFGDTKLLWKSGLVKGQSAARKVRVNINGVKELRLVVEDGGDGPRHDLADWAEALVRK